MRILHSVSFCLLIGCGLFATEISAQHCPAGPSYQSYQQHCPTDYHHYAQGLHDYHNSNPYNFNNHPAATMESAEELAVDEPVNDPVSSKIEDVSSKQEKAKSKTLAVAVDSKVPSKNDAKPLNKKSDASADKKQVSQNESKKTDKDAQSPNKPTKQVQIIAKGDSLVSAVVTPKTSR